MSTLRDNLKDHPIQSILTATASLATIIGFFFVLRTESCKKSPQEGNNQQTESRKDSGAIEQKLSENAKSPQVMTENDTSTNLPQNKPEKMQPLIEANKNDNKERNTFSLNDKTYESMNKYDDYQITFYDQKGNEYLFIAKYDIFDFHGTAIQNKNDILIKGNYGESTLKLTNKNKFLVGFLKGQNWDVSVNAQLRN